MTAAAPDTAAAVEFHTGVADPVVFACRLLRKAYRLGAHVGVTAAAARLAELDRALWVAEERDFLPHVRLAGMDSGAGTPEARLLARSPLWLAPQASDLLQTADRLGLTAPPVLLNLGADLPPAEAGFGRIIEVVGLDVDEADAGRARWRQYKARGLSVLHHPAQTGH